MLWRMRKSTLERPNHCRKDKTTEPLVRPVHLSQRVRLPVTEATTTITHAEHNITLIGIGNAMTHLLLCAPSPRLQHIDIALQSTHGDNVCYDHHPEG